MEIADVLERAADLIEPRGCWIKGDFAKDADGVCWRDVDTYNSNVESEEFRPVAFCMLGAVAVASGKDPDNPPASAMRLIGDAIHGENIPDWNDAKRRRKCEVVAKLREAAAKARDQPNV